jgi:hypothetical protein
MLDFNVLREEIGDNDSQPYDVASWQHYLVFRMRHGVCRILEQLSPYLVIPLNVHTILGLDYCKLSTVRAKAFDILIVSTERDCFVHDTADNMSTRLYQECRKITSMVLHRPSISQMPGDMSRETIFGVDIHDEGEHVTSGHCTFIMFIGWTDVERMRRFKDPTQESWRSMSRKCDRDWWEQHAMAPMRELAECGARISVETCCSMGDSLLYPSAIRSSKMPWPWPVGLYGNIHDGGILQKIKPVLGREKPGLMGILSRFSGRFREIFRHRRS